MGIITLSYVKHYLYCYSNPLTSLDVSKNTSLYTLSCYSNQLTSLDLSQNVALCTLYCYNNQLTTLDIVGILNYNIYLAMAIHLQQQNMML